MAWGGVMKLQQTLFQDRDELYRLIEEQEQDRSNVVYHEVITPKVHRMSKRNWFLRRARKKIVKFAHEEGLSMDEIGELLNLDKSVVSRIYSDNATDNSISGGLFDVD